MNIQVLNAKRGRIKGALTRLEKFADELTLDTELETILTRFDKLEEIQDDFKELLNEYDKLVADKDYQSQENAIEEFEVKYFKIKSKFKKVINDKETPITSSPVSDTINADNSVILLNQLAQQQSTFLEKLNARQEHLETKLPILKVPCFEGDIKEWVTFKNMFLNLVDKHENLSKTQKFQYLKSYLKGEAAGMIKHMEVSETGYDEALEKLSNRYEKPHQIVKAFIDSFLSLPTVAIPSASGLRKLTDSADELLRGLKALSEYAESRDPWLIHLLLQKVDNDTKESWAEELVEIKTPKWEHFLKFLEKRSFALESYSSNPNKFNFNKKTVQMKGFQTTVSGSCSKCKGQHYLYQCPEFISMDIVSRREYVKEKKLCFNCLKSKHNANKCQSKSRCKHCNTRHHTLVHASAPRTFVSLEDNHVILPQDNNTPTRENSIQTPVLNCHFSSQYSTSHISVLLPTAVAKVKDIKNIFQDVRILLDSGSQLSFIAESCAQRLALPRKNARISISGLSSVGAGITRGKINITLYSQFDASKIKIEAYVLPKITSNLPSCSFDISNLSHISQLALADPGFNTSKPIDILLGADKFFEIIRNGHFKLNDEDPIAQLTSFGWVLAGEIGRLPIAAPSTSVQALHTCIDIDATLQKFWELEEVPQRSLFTDEEMQAETNFCNTVTRSTDGKYVVNLPFRDFNFNFGDSIGNAINRLKAMERRFSQNSKLKSMYSDFINEYISLGHMEQVNQSENSSLENTYYLPYHAVFKEESTTSKIRVVFDGSAKTKFGISLNQKLLPGPCILKDLFAICLGFRRHKYSFSADIEKMFRQIWISKDHQDFQRIVWRENIDIPIKHYRLKTVTYGTTSAPFLANRVLKQLALDYVDQYPLACEVVQKDFYMDDVMSGANDLTAILSLKNQLLSLIEKGGFCLRKWVSNCWPLMQSLSEQLREFDPMDFEDETKNVKILGLRWHSSTDEFSYKVNSFETSVITKRRILSDASKLFDPLGFLSPSIILAKSLLQLLWLQKLDWDQEVSDAIKEKWIKFTTQLKQVEKLKIPRQIWVSHANFELHGFCDASEVAYSAVIYCRAVFNDSIHTSLVAAKTKVAPIKQISIPRLELSGALLLCKLFDAVRTSLEIDNCSFTAWTDSNIVLSWLSSHPRKWKTVSNRVAQILEIIPRNKWNHISSKSNPADCASRGLLTEELLSYSCWWKGPEWLSQDYNYWPKDNNNMQANEILIEAELKRNITTVHVSNPINDTLEYLFVKFSSWSKIYRTVAYCLRFLKNASNKLPKISRPLKSFELDKAKNILLRWSQSTTFAEEIKNLSFKKPISSKSKIISLAPFLDENKILRVGGRIENSQIPYSTQHPIILSSQHGISTLITSYYHKKYLHPGVSHLFTLIRQQFWILGARNLLKKFVFKCISCFRQRQGVATQLMSSLPPSRVQMAYPFMKSGVDYAGPITLRLAKGRNPKYPNGHFSSQLRSYFNLVQL